MSGYIREDELEDRICFCEKGGVVGEGCVSNEVATEGTLGS